MSTRLSVVMIAKNAADLLPDCLSSVAWADEIVILDSGSTDNTADVARAAGAKGRATVFSASVRRVTPRAITC